MYRFTITNAGCRFFARITAEQEPLVISRVMFGTGTPPEDENGLLDMTALVKPLSEGVCTTPIYENDTVKMSLQFRNDLNGGLKKTVYLKEFGLFATDPDGSEVLIFYGDLSSAPDSVLAYDGAFIHTRNYDVKFIIGAVPNVQISGDASAFITSEDAQALIDAAVNPKAEALTAHTSDTTKHLPSGGTTGDILIRSSGGGAVWRPPMSNPNLLINWYFLDPISQRNIVSGAIWPAFSYGIDRWHSLSLDLTKWVYGEGIYLLSGGNSLIEQSMKSDTIPNGTCVTFSAIVNDQLMPYTFTWGQPEDTRKNDVVLSYLNNYPSTSVCALRIWNLSQTTAKITAVKLELGSQQTLAHQDENGNWVLNDPPPNKTLELLKCQRYYWQPDTVFTATWAQSVYLNTNIQFPVTMRTTPTITITSFGADPKPGILSETVSGLNTEIAVAPHFYTDSGITLLGITNDKTPQQHVSYCFKLIAEADL